MTGVAAFERLRRDLQHMLDAAAPPEERGDAAADPHRLAQHEENAMLKLAEAVDTRRPKVRRRCSPRAMSRKPAAPRRGSKTVSAGRKTRCSPKLSP